MASHSPLRGAGRADPFKDGARSSEQLTDAEEELGPPARSPTPAEEGGAQQRVQIETTGHIAVEIGRAEPLKGAAVFHQEEHVALAPEKRGQLADLVQITEAA